MRWKLEPHNLYVRILGILFRNTTFSSKSFERVCQNVLTAEQLNQPEKYFLASFEPLLSDCTAELEYVVKI